MPLRRFLELLVVRTSLVPLSSIIHGESRQTISGGMKTPFLKNYMPDVVLRTNQPFSGAIADNSRQKGRLPCPLWDPTKKTVSSASFKRFPLCSSQKYLSFAFVLNLFRWSTHPRNPHYLYIVFAEVGGRSRSNFPGYGLQYVSTLFQLEQKRTSCYPMQSISGL